MPKWKFRPPGLSGSKSPAPANLSVVLFEAPRSAEPPRNQGMFWASALSTFARGVASGDALGDRRAKLGRSRSHPAGSSRRCICSISVARSGNLRSVVGKERLPAAPRLGPARADAGSEMLPDAVGHKELGILGPAIGALGEPDLLVAQRLAVGCGGVDLVRRAVADVAVQNDQRRPARGLAEDRERMLDALEIVGVADPQHVPVDRQGSAPPRPR